MQAAAWWQLCMSLLHLPALIWCSPPSSRLSYSTNFLADQQITCLVLWHSPKKMDFTHKHHFKEKNFLPLPLSNANSGVPMRGCDPQPVQSLIGAYSKNQHQPPATLNTLRTQHLNLPGLWGGWGWAGECHWWEEIQSRHEAVPQQPCKYLFCLGLLLNPCPCLLCCSLHSPGSPFSSGSVSSACLAAWLKPTLIFASLMPGWGHPLCGTLHVSLDLPGNLNLSYSEQWPLK